MQIPTTGERNCNPGNLRYVPAIQWYGLASPAKDAKGFCVFTDATLGLRALARDLLVSWREGHKTVRALVSRYAPEDDPQGYNNTAAYVADVGQRCQVAPDEELDLDLAFLVKLVKAIVWHENGRCIYGEKTLESACTMAWQS